MSIRSLLFVLLIPVISFASKLKSEGQVVYEAIENGKAVRATLKPGFYFNEGSPVFTETDKKKTDAKSRSTKELVFALPESKSGSYKLKFYVCDDAKTVCELHSKDWGKAPVPGASHGGDQFQKDDLQAAFELAKKQNKLVFVDFAGAWCPPCIRLEHEVFPTKEFKKASQKYILVRLDVDKPENEKWMEKYSVKAFPTLVVLNPEGEELGRQLDFQTKERLSFFLDSLAKSIPATLGELKKKAEAGDKKSQGELAFAYLKALNYVDALDWYEKSGLKTYRRAEARIGFWNEQVADAEREAGKDSKQNSKKDEDKKKAKESLILALQESVSEYKNAIQAIDWQKQLAEVLAENAETNKNVKSAKKNQPGDQAESTDQEQSKAAFLKAKEMAMVWINNPTKLNQEGPPELGNLNLPDLWYKVGEIEKALGNEAAEKQAYEKAVQETLKLKPTEKTPTHVIYLVAYMKPIKELAEMEPWLEKLKAAYPEEFTYHQRHAKLLLDKGEARRALPVAEKAYSLAFGSNQLSIGLLLAKIHKELENKDQVKSLLKDLKAQPFFGSQRNRYASKAITDFETSLKK